MVVIILCEIFWPSDFVLQHKRFGIANISFWFPSVFSYGISFASHKEGVVTQSSLMSDDCFDLIFFISINKVRWRPQEVGSVFHSLFMWGEEGGVEYWMDLPVLGNVEVVGSTRDDLLNFKWTSSLHSEFSGSIHTEVGGFEPHLIPHFPRNELGKDPFLHLLLGDPMGGLCVISC